VTVIATGFTGERSRRADLEMPREEVEIKPFSHDDLDIPAFLRRRS